MSDYLDILAEKREKWMNRPTLNTNQTPPEAPMQDFWKSSGPCQIILPASVSITSHFYEGIRQCVAENRKGFWLLVHVLFKSRGDLNVSGSLSGNLHDIFMIYCCCLVVKGCPTLCNPMDCSTPGFHVLHLEFAQTHVHCVSDAIQPSHPLLSPFSSYSQYFPASESFPMSQLFAPGGQSTGTSTSASVPPMNIQSWFSLGLSGLILLSKGLSKVFSSTAVWKHEPHEQCVKAWLIGVGYRISLCMESWPASHTFLLAEDWR